MSLRWEGIDEVLANLDRIATAAPDGAKGALSPAIDHIAAASAELVPVETGTLVGSRKVNVDGKTASIEYGTPYARYQHYRLDLHHEHGQALYLEQPVRTETGAAVRIIADGAFGSL